MNLAGLQPSAVSPKTWTAKDQLEAVMKELLTSHPHIIALQECPSAAWAAGVFADDSYISIGSTASHAGFINLLIKKGVFADHQPVKLQREIPAVMARLTLSNNTEESLYVASVHLEPFQSGSFERQVQMQELLEAAQSMPLIVLGDTNMRDGEDSYHEKSYQDAWKVLGALEATRYTWDTIIHGTSFNQYYGTSTRQYQKRYDRVYFTTNVLKPTEFTLIANQPIPPSKDHFLSDHFGVAVSVQIKQQPYGS
jgi:endonuclease/exonuclease/phosphatase family metal-dependent hydrolase